MSRILILMLSLTFTSTAFPNSEVVQKKLFERSVQHILRLIILSSNASPCLYTDMSGENENLICFYDFDEDGSIIGLNEAGKKRNQLFHKITDLLALGEIVAEDSFSHYELKTILPNFVVKSAQIEPTFFNLDGGHKIASTYPYRGADIFVNSDLFYKKSFLGYFEPISTENIAAIVFHELGHQVGEESHQYLDLLAHQLQSFVLAPKSKRIYSNIVLNNKSVYIEHLESTLLPEVRESIILNTTTDIIDLSTPISKEIKKSLNLCKLNGNYKGLDWVNLNLHSDESLSTNNKFEIQLKSSIQVNCPRQNNLDNNLNRIKLANILINIKLKPETSNSNEVKLHSITVERQ